MFNRKKKEIERLKNNITKLNENRLELRGENIRLQKEVANLNEKFDLLNNKYDMINNAILGLYEKFEPKKTKKVKIKSSSFDLNKKGTINVDEVEMPKKATKEEKDDIDKWYFSEYPTIMKKVKYNQTMLAKEMGVSISSICSLNKKDRTTSFELKQRVKDFLLGKLKENGE